MSCVAKKAKVSQKELSFVVAIEEAISQRFTK